MSGNVCNTNVSVIFNQTPSYLHFDCYNFSCASKDTGNNIKHIFPLYSKFNISARGLYQEKTDILK